MLIEICLLSTLFFMAVTKDASITADALLHSPSSIRVNAAAHVLPLSSSSSLIRSFCLHGWSIPSLPLFRPTPGQAQQINTWHSPAGEPCQLLLPNPVAPASATPSLKLMRTHKIEILYVQKQWKGAMWEQSQFKTKMVSFISGITLNKNSYKICSHQLCT